MKLAFYILTILSCLCAVIFKFWAIVSFILYLVKDRAFDWFSLWLCVGGWVGAVIFYICAETRKCPKPQFNRTSNFQKKLEQMAKERKEKQLTKI